MKFIFNWIPEIKGRRLRREPGALVAVALLTLAPAAAADAGNPRLAERAELVMGSITRIAIFDGPTESSAFAAAFAAVRAVDADMSLYLAGSELRRVNDHAARHAEPVSADLFALLTRARALSDETDGAFDVTVLPLLRLWGAYPGLGLGAGNRQGVGFEGLQLDPTARAVSFRRPGMALDLGGIAKGFAADRAAAALRATGVLRARIDVAGNLLFVGEGPAGVWRVAVRDPDAPETPLGVLVLGADVALSTSGNYARDFAHEGWRAPSHIYDPRTGRPAGATLAVTVWARDATTADALSTALVVIGPEGAASVLAREPGAGALVVDGVGSGRVVRLQGAPPVAWQAAPPASNRS